MTSVLAIAAVNLKRLFRDRSNIFFVIIFPIVLILVLGLSFGSAWTPKLGVVGGQDGPQAENLLTALNQAKGMEVHLLRDEEELRTAVERGRLNAGLVVPAGYDEAVRAGQPVALRYLARAEPQAQQLGVAVRSAVTEATVALRAARFAGGDFDLTLARAAAVRVPGVLVETSTTGTSTFPASNTTFDVSATTQLLLFVFLTSMTGSAALIETRRLGMSRRMFAAPMTTGRILLGEGLGRVAVALLQGLIIMFGSALLFGVGWGDPLGAAALLLMFALVGGGAALLLGSALRTEQQAVSVGLLLGLGLGALGGSMLPLELFPETMRTVARFTPHAWANDGFTELVRRGGGVLDILPQLGVLAAFAVVLFGLGAWRLRLSLTR